MNKLLTLLVFLFAIPVVAQTYGRMDFSLQNAQGQAISGGTVNVFTQTAWGTQGTTAATLYSSPNGGTPITPPLLTDGQGHAYAYAATPTYGYTVQYVSQFTGTNTYLDQVPSTNGIPSGACVITPPASGTSTAAIQAALSGTCGTISLAPGTYTSDRLSLNRSNVTVQGAGKGVTVIQAVCPLTLTPQAGSSGGLFYAQPLSGSLSNVHIKGLTLLGCDSTVTVTSVTFNGTNAVIQATNNLTAGENVGFNGLVGGQTVGMNGGGSWTVLSTGLSGTQFEVAYGVSAAGPYAQSAANYWLWNGASVSYPTHQGLVLDGCGQCSVESVAVQNMGAESILLNPSKIGDNPIIQNNSVVGGAGNSISSNFAYGAQFLGNSITNTFGGNCLGWSGDATVATGNVIRGCSGDGINSGGSGYVHDVLGYDAEISSNIIDGSHSCIHMTDDGATSTTTKWYDVANNICSNYNFAGFFSDLTQTTDEVFVTDLTVTGGGQNAEFGGTIAALFNTGAGTYHISNSHFIGSGSGTGQVYGIYVLSGSPNIFAAHNTIINNIDGDIATNGSATPTYDNGINLLTGGNTVPSVQVTGLTPSRCVQTGTNGLLTVAAAPCGSGSGSIPTNATFVFTGNSTNLDDGHLLSSAITITAYTAPSSGIVTFTNSGTNGLAAGNWVYLASVSGWPSPSGNNGGTGFNLFQVISTGLSATQFEINVGSLSGISLCSSSCGSAYSAMKYYPFLTVNSTGFPTGANAATTVLIPQDISGNTTYKGLAANYSAMFHAISPAVTGNPGYFIVNDWENDIGFCDSVSNIEGYITSIMSQAHTDGWIVVFGSEPAKNVSAQYGAGFCSYPLPPTEEQVTLNNWLATLGKTINNSASGEYWDIFLPLGAVLNDGYNTNLLAGNGGYEPQGAKFAASDTANALLSGSGDPLPLYQSYFGQANSTNNSTYNGYVYWPTADGIQAFQWLNNNFSLAMSLGTGSFVGLTLDSDYPNTINDSGQMTNGSIFGITETGANSGFINASPMTYFYVPNQTATATPFWEWGHDGTTGNAIRLAMSWAGNASPSNFLTLGLRGVNGIKIDGAGNVYIPGIATSASPNPICPNGTGGALTTSGCSSTAPLFGTGNPTGVNTPTFVQVASGQSNGLNITFGSHVALGDVILVFYTSSTGSGKTVGDSLGTSFSVLNDASTLYFGEVICGVAPASGADTISSGGGPGQNQTGIAYEFSGMSCTTDTIGTGVTNSSSIALSNTTNVANDLLFSPLLDDDSSSSTSIIGGSWTANGVVHGEQNINAAYQVATTATSYSGTWTVLTSSYAYIISLEASSTPVSGTQGQVYYQTSTTPYTPFVYNSSAWHQVN